MTLRSEKAVQAGLAFIAAATAIVLLALSINVNFGFPFNFRFGIPPTQDYSLKALFRDANGLNRGADVVIGGHNVGEVVGVQVQGRDAAVSMRVMSQYAPMHKGTIARIRYSTLLAQKYVELTPSSKGGELESGATIPSAETVTPVDFDQFLSTLDPETRDRLQKVVQNAGGGVEGRQAAINDFLDQLYGLSRESRAGLSTLHNHTGDIDSIVADLAITSRRLSQSRDQLGDLIATANDVNKTMADHDVALTRFLTHFANVMGDFDATLNGNEQNFHDTVVTLDPLVGDLNNTLGLVYAYYHNDKGPLTDATVKLLPEVSSAIDGRPENNCPVRDPPYTGQACDANGNYLRQKVVLNCQLDNNCPTPSGQQSAQPAQPAPPPPPSGRPATPNVTPCPLPTPSVTPPPGVPSPCPSISPVPKPSPCVPLPTPSPPAGTPTPSPPNCPTPPAVPAPALPGVQVPGLPTVFGVLFGL